MRTVLSSYPLYCLFFLATLFGCRENPVDPTDRDGLQVSGTAPPHQPSEEEIFGVVLTGGSRITATNYFVRLTEMDSRACIHPAVDPGECRGAQTMRVRPAGSRPGLGGHMWGWYNNLDSDSNPCNPDPTKNGGDQNEMHDEDLNGVADGGLEKHCVTLGKYKVQLIQNGSVLRTRLVDHLAVQGEIGTRGIEDPTVPSPDQNNFRDTIVNFDVVGSTTYIPAQLDSIDIDDPTTPTQFAPGDTVVAAGTRVRVRSAATLPPYGNVGVGRLLARVYYDHGVNNLDRTGHWNPDLVIRTKEYVLAPDTARVRVEATPPNIFGNDGTISTRARTILVQGGTPPPPPPPDSVASVEVTPSSASILVGQTVTLTATPKNANGDPLNRIVAWSSSNSAVASVTASGNTATVTGQSAGPATIRAEVDGVVGQAIVTVTTGPVPVASVEVTPSSVTLQRGQNATLTATPRAADGTALNDRIVQWATSNANVASIVSSGNTATVTGRGAGTATITASVEGKSGFSTVTVPAVDAATAAGNTFPGGMLSGGIASVSLWMSNSGSTTWTTAAGYNLVLARDVSEWLPSSVDLPQSASPETSTAFHFDLRHLWPGTSGTVPAFYRMSHDTLFGEENGADILLSSDGCIICSGMTAETTTLEADPATTWLGGAVDGGTSRLALDGVALRSQGAAQIEYVFAHRSPRALDIVIKFTFDPAVLRPVRPQAGPGAASLAQTAGLWGSGTYWVRLTGTVPKGRGRIVAFPFQLIPGAEPPGDLGTVTIYYPRR